MADDHSESGIGLNIGPNGLKALQCHSPGLAQARACCQLPLAPLAHFAYRRRSAIRLAMLAGADPVAGTRRKMRRAL